MPTGSLIAILLLSLFGCTQQEDQIIVNIENGELLGERREHFFAFEGIPYAKAPVGRFRFEPPRPYTEQWKEPRDARKLGENCLQWDHFKFDVDDKLKGSEDCLFVNVYTPTVDPSFKLPVFVYIHGGAFMFGNGDYYGPKIITERDAVMVNFNYRLGPLGFLITEDKHIPGNMGMKDQVQLLHWVQKNIANFGGDPSQVTITGFSAGGASVHLHYMSPLSVGLFKNGISHSGCALNPWVFMENGKQRTEKLAQIVKCPTSTVQKMVACLKEKPAEELVRAVSKFQPWLYNPFSPFAVTIEPKVEGAFLTEKPIDVIRDRKYQELPWLASATEAEGLYPAGEFMRHPEYLPQIDKGWNDIMPHILHYNDTIAPERLNEVSKRIRKHYLGDAPLTKENFSKLVDIISDRLYKYGLSQAMRLQGSITPAFFYHFRFKTVYGDGEDMSQNDEGFGVAHGEDVYLLYSTEDLRGSVRPYTFDEKRMIKLLLDMYLSFSKTGKPSLGDYPMPAFDFTQPKALTHACVDSPDSVATAAVEDFGEEEFWMSLGFEENL